MTAADRSQNWIYRNTLLKKTTKVYLSLGSNIGDREKFLAQAIEKLSEGSEQQILQASSLYETEPVGCDGEQWFLNQAVYLVTLKPIYLFFSQIQKIEQELGRTAKRNNQPREIDIDLLFFGDHVMTETDLTVPHPRLHQRGFVLEPLVEINPQLWHPVLEKSVSTLLEEAPKTHQVRRYTPVAI